MAAGEAHEVARIVDEWGVDLVHSSHAALVNEAAAALPLELATERPGLALRFEDIGRLPIGSTPLDLPQTPEEARAEVARNGDLRLRHMLIPLTTRRRLHRFGEAVALVRAADPLAEASAYPLYGDRSRIVPYWYLQAGVTLQHAGDVESARRYYLNAWTHRAREPFGFVAGSIAVHLALLHAFYGDHAASTIWLERAREEGRRTGLWIDVFAEANLTMTQAIQAMDRLDSRAGDHLHAAPRPGQRAAQWPMLLWLFVQHALTSGDHARARGRLDDAVTSRPAEATHAGLAAALVPLARAEIHLAAGQGQQALAAIADAADVGGFTRTLRARIHLLAGEPVEALAVAEPVLGDAATSTRARIEALLVMAAAHQGLGERDAAADAARRAVTSVLEQDAPRLLASVPRKTLHELVSDVPGLGPLLVALDERGVGPLYPASIKLISLTNRERALLRELESGRTLNEIAAAHFVSVNTVRTHLANLRRKLDARSRREVLAKAHVLGLMDRAD